ncbi:amidohydrolase [Herbaspirillum sp. RV1423]|uniref:amidohydrolase family protein n=1 Tax=Herbaspirillum sp. RV1423 TaxID=1443993 RepID=UPI0004B8917F|nr:amidohydrolase family protein [Herbaspirillum sp. RV1423]
MTSTDLPTPTGACDCHIHIYDYTRFALAPTAISTPPQALWQDYRREQEQLGLTRAVVVQPTGYGFDNRCTLDALEQAQGSARGIVAIPLETDESELARMDAAGVRGVRFMMIANGGGVMRWDMLEPLAAKIAPLGWNINLQIDGRDFAQYEDVLGALPCRLVIDHNGKFLKPVARDHAGMRSLLRLLESGRCWIKLSAPYETSQTGAPGYEDVGALAQIFVHEFPERCLWASNWPHPGRNPPPSNRDLLDLLSAWAPSSELRRRILVDNPAALYRF